MKKAVRILAVVMSLWMLCTVLVSCGNTLDGKYSKTLTGVTTSFEFDSDKEVELSMSVGGLSYDIDGTYEIKDGKITFIFEGADEDRTFLESVLSGFSQAVDFEKGDGFVKIAGVTYDKVPD